MFALAAHDQTKGPKKARPWPQARARRPGGPAGCRQGGPAGWRQRGGRRRVGRGGRARRQGRRRRGSEEEGSVEDEGGLEEGELRRRARQQRRPRRPRALRGRRQPAIERFDALQTYLREVQRHPLLTPEETHDARGEVREDAGPGASPRSLVTSNLRLVVKIAYEYRRAYKNIMDLVQEGNIGLMQAVKRYDPYRGVKLSSYAAWWIRAYILRFILNNWRLVKLGTTQAQRKLFFNLRKKRAELRRDGHRPDRTPRSPSSSTCPRATSPRWTCASRRARSRSTRPWATPRGGRSRRST